MNYLAMSTVLVASLSYAQAATAERSVRIALLVDERVDQQKRQRSDLEAAIVEAMGASKSIVFVDAEQARAVRESFGEKSILQADAKRLITSVDADVLIVGEAELTNEPSVAGLTVVEGTAQLKIIATDSAQVLGAARSEGIGRHFTSKSKARAQAIGRMSTTLTQKIRRVLEGLRGGQRYELVVELDRPMDISTVDAMARCIEATPSATDVRVLHHGPDRVRMELSSEATARSLAVVFGREVRCRMFVYAFSSRLIRARHRTPSTLTMALARFERRGSRQKRDQWLTSEVPRVIAVELASTELFEHGPGQPVVSRARAAKKRRGALALVGNVSVRGEDLSISATVIATWSRRSLVSKRRTCQRKNLTDCIAALGADMATELPRAVEKYRREIPFDANAITKSPETIKLVSVDVDDIYPARAGHLQTAPLGTVVVENRSDAPMANVQLTAMVEIFSKARTSPSKPIALAPGQSATLPVFLVLDVDALARNQDNRTVGLHLSVGFDQNNLRHTYERTKAIVVLERNAVNWSASPPSIAAYVTPRDDTIQQMTSRARRSIRNSKTETLAMPIALFGMLSGLQYAPDPANPFKPEELDYVRYPRETLRAGGGDCDDLSVLFATLLESAGIRTAFIRTPGHVFVGLDAGAAAKDRMLQPDAFIRRGGRVWIPVETTRIGHSFEDAWARARTELREAARAGRPIDDKTFIVVRDAWKTFPPTNLAKDIQVVDAPVPKSTNVAAALETLRSNMLAAAQKRIDALLGSRDPKKMNAAGIGLVRLGEWDRAERAFEKSLLANETAAATNNIGNVQLGRGNTKKAFGLYERALKLDRGDIDICLNAFLAAYALWRDDPRAEKPYVKLMNRAYELSPGRLRALATALSGGGEGVTGAKASGTSARGVGLEILAFLAKRGEKTDGPVASQATTAPLISFVEWVE